MSAGLGRTSVPSSIHCDHLIQASTGADSDLEVISLQSQRKLPCNANISGLSYLTERYSTSSRAQPRNMESNFGDLALASFIR